MKITTRLDIIAFDGVELVVNDALKRLAKLPVADLVVFLKGPRLWARRDHATILKNVMRDEVWKFKLVSRVAEKGLSHDFYSRIDHFEDSPVTVLQNLYLKMVKIQPEMIDEYLEDVWLYALQVVKGKEKELVSLLERAKDAKVSKIVLKDLFPAINPLFADVKGEIDGISVNLFLEKGLHSATLKEIREIGEANGVFLPTNITKQNILDEVQKVIPRTFKGKEATRHLAETETMTVANLKLFVEEHKLDVPTELRKSDISEMLVKNYVAKESDRVVANTIFVLPERVDMKKDLSEEDPKVARLSKKVENLEKELETAKAESVKEPVKIIEKEVVTVVDEEAVLREQERSHALSQELEAIKSKLEEKPKEVLVKVPGPTVVRTVISKKELEKQKEKYEQIIADQEKERALLIGRVDELAEYNKAISVQQEQVKQVMEVEPVHEEVVPQKASPNDELHAKVDRLMDKIHEMQLDMLKRELDIVTRQQQGDGDRETEVNLYFDSNLANKMLGTTTEEKAPEVTLKKGKKTKVKKTKKKRVVLCTIIWLVIIALIVLMGGWLLEYYQVTPTSYGPTYFAWLRNMINSTTAFLYGITEGFFAWIRSIRDTIVGWFSA